MAEFKTLILEGIPKQLPEPKKRSLKLSHAPKKKDYSFQKRKNSSITERTKVLSRKIP